MRKMFSKNQIKEMIEENNKSLYLHKIAVDGVDSQENDVSFIISYTTSSPNPLTLEQFEVDYGTGTGREDNSEQPVIVLNGIIYFTSGAFDGELDSETFEDEVIPLQ